MILFSAALELENIKKNNMSNLILDAAKDKIFLTIIDKQNIYSVSYENSKINFEGLIVLINKFLAKNNYTLGDIKKIYVNRGPGSFAGIRNSLSITKALFLTNKIDYYCYSSLDFNKSDFIKHQDIPKLCDKFDIKKNLIKPVYIS